MILTKITTLEFSVLTSVEASPELSLTSALTEVRFPRKFRPRKDFSHMAEKSDRAGEIYRAEIGFGNFRQENSR
jgi:hypothetical protein